MFFCISAYLYANRDIKENKRKWLLKRYIELIVPCFLSVILGNLVFFCFEGYIPIETIKISVLSGIGLEIFNESGWMFIQFWYLSYILLCYLTIPFIQKIDVKKMKEKSFWLMMIVGCLSFQLLFMTLKKVLNLTNFYSFGVLARFYLPYFLIRRYDFNGFKLKKVMRIFLLISILGEIAIIFTRYNNIFNISLLISEQIFIYTQTISGVTLFYYLYRFLEKNKINKKLMKISDEYSYYIYLTHCYFIGYSTSLLFRWDNLLYGAFFALLLTLVSSIILKIISKNILSPVKKSFKL